MKSLLIDSLLWVSFLVVIEHITGQNVRGVVTQSVRSQLNREPLFLYTSLSRHRHAQDQVGDFLQHRARRLGLGRGWQPVNDVGQFSASWVGISRKSFLLSTFAEQGDPESIDEDSDNWARRRESGDAKYVFAPTDEADSYVSEAEEAERANDLISATLGTARKAGEAPLLTQIELQEEVSKSFLKYAMSIILGRAIPDARDGLKPVHRRILYAMHQLRLVPNSSHRKCARVVGEVLGKFHPHGDVAVYDALVRMAQTFSSNHPLIDGHGNFGSIDADPAAAMRYTECRLTSFSHQTLLGDDYGSSTFSSTSSNGASTSTASATSGIVDFVSNFDGNEIEPVVLPAKVPLLLLNGASGIAVGMATNVPPHNLNELLTACVALIQKQRMVADGYLTDDELFSIIPAPDFPTGASILGTAGARQLYKAGHGGITMRAITHVETISNNPKRSSSASTTLTTSATASTASNPPGRTAIVVTELPFQLNKSALLQKIAALVNEKKLEGISDLRDESDRECGIRIVIELKRDAVVGVVLKNLYQKTALQSTFSGNFLALMNKNYANDFDYSNNKSITNNDQHDSVVTPQRFTLRKALNCFLNFRFATIRRRCTQQFIKVQNRIHVVDGLLLALQDVDTVITIIRTATDQNQARLELQKKLSISVIQTDSILKLQLGQLTRLNNEKLHSEKTNLEETASELNALLTVDNKVYQVMVDELEEIKKKFGRPRRTHINTIDDDSGNVSDMDLIRNSRSVIVVTRGGYIKRLPLKTFERQRRGTRGKRGTTLSPTIASLEKTIGNIQSQAPATTTTTTTTISGSGTSSSTTLGSTNEEIAHCFSCNDHDTLLMLTQAGIAYGIRAYQIPIAGRTARGQPIPTVVPALKPTDGITTILPISTFSENDYLVLTTENGWIKKTPLNAFENMSNKRGLVIATLDDGDKLRWCQQVHNDELDDILIGTAKGMAIRFKASEIRPTSRTSRGVRAIKLKPGDTIADVNILPGGSFSATTSNSGSDNKNYTVPHRDFALIVTAKGYGKRVPTSSFRTTSRSGVGVIATKFKMTTSSSARSNRIIDERLTCLLAVSEDDEILVITAKGVMLRQRVIDIPSQSRAATGVTIQKLDDGDHIVSVGIVPSYEETEGGSTNANIDQL